jgi:hypothetical protein
LDFVHVKAGQLDEGCFGWEVAGAAFRHDYLGGGKNCLGDFVFVLLTHGLLNPYCFVQ